jgi:hypothetical protein
VRRLIGRLWELARIPLGRTTGEICRVRSKQEIRDDYIDQVAWYDTAVPEVR